MGTRAVVRCNAQDWIATHWDGYPRNGGLGQSLLKELRNKFTAEGSNAQYFNKHGKADAACWRAAADHSIDFATTLGGQEFDRVYGDFAEYQYKVSVEENKNCAKVYYRPLDGEWKGSPKDNGWKTLGEVCMRVRKKPAKKRSKRKRGDC